MCPLWGGLSLHWLSRRTVTIRQSDRDLKLAMGTQDLRHALRGQTVGGHRAPILALGGCRTKSV